MISCRGRYATRAMIELALHHGEAPVPLSLIADQQGISRKYLQQLMGILRRSGYLRVVKGNRGGFLLAVSPSEISLGDILYAVEGDMNVVECVASPDVCERSDLCGAQLAWRGLSETIKKYLESTTLETLAREEMDARSNDGDGRLRLNEIHLGRCPSSSLRPSGKE